MKIVDFVFPVRCIWCSFEWTYLCRSCKKKLSPHPEICPVTHRFSPDFQVHIDSTSSVSYAWIVIWFVYEDLLKKLILQLKYYHCYDVAWFLIDRLLLIIQTNQTLQQVMKKNNVIVSSIPSHRYRKYFIKWYNQSELLAKWIAVKLWVSYKPLLIKRKYTRIQAFLSRQQRMNNLQWVFSLCNHNILKWDELILFVDDVMTTWSTINEAAKELKKYYPRLTIRWAVLGRHA